MLVYSTGATMHPAPISDADRISCALNLLILFRGIFFLDQRTLPIGAECNSMLGCSNSIRASPVSLFMAPLISYCTQPLSMFIHIR